MNTIPTRQRAYTLLEMTIVVAIVAAAAAIAIPSVSATHHQKLDLAASQVADAFRFARDEAKRTGLVHGVSADAANDQIRVFRLDEGPNPNAMVFDVRQPVSKQIYAINLGQSPQVGVTLSAVDGLAVGVCNDTTNIAIDAAGVTRCIEPIASRISGSSVTLSTGMLTRRIEIDEYTGRVSIQ